jgi:hypothetical protein
MVRLAAELLLLLGLLLLTLHITVLRGSGASDRQDAAAGNVSGSQLQVSAPPEGACVVERSWVARKVLSKRAWYIAEGGSSVPPRSTFA